MSPTVIGVVGVGTMGRGIVQLFAQAGHVVRCHDAQSGAAAKAVQAVLDQLGKLVEKGRLSADALVAIRQRIHVSEDLASFADCQVVIEAIVEDLAVKRELFRLGAERILAILLSHHAATGDPRYRPSAWLARRVALGLPLTTPEAAR